MSDTPGQPLPVQGAAPQEPASSPTPEATPPSADKWAGKSVEDIKAAYQALETKLGTQGQELGELRKRVEQAAQPEPAPYTPSYEGLYGTPPAQPGYAPQQPFPPYPGPTPTPPAHGAPGQAEAWKLNWDAPESAIDQRLDQRLEQRLAQYIPQFRGQLAQSNFYAGRNTAMSQRPDLYKGIEREVESTIQNAWRNGGLNEASMLDPETWHTAAWAIQGRKQGFKVAPQAPASGTAPAFNETPQGNRVQQPEPRQIRISNADANIDVEKMRVGLGFSEEETAELLSGGKK